MGAQLYKMEILGGLDSVRVLVVKCDTGSPLNFKWVASVEK